MSDRVMLDPSLVLHPEAIVQLLELAHEGALQNVALPGEFLEHGRNPEFLRDLKSFYGLKRVADDRLINLFLRTAEGQLEPHFDDRSVALFLELASEGRTNETLLVMVAQEHAFLLHQSWVFAKVKKSFETMIEAGASAVEVSKKRFDGVVRRTLKKSADQDLTGKERLRAISKWTAVSGPPVLALFEPISGTVISSAAGLFLLADP